MKTRVNDYYWLAKPGIVYGNAIAAIAGYFLAANGNVRFEVFIAMLAGICLVMASACVFNNVIDRNMDKKMKRTSWRPTVKGTISVRNAVTYGATLGVAGALLLGFFTTMWALAWALIGVFFYVVVYGFAKRQTMHGTVIGSVAGAVPPVVGYTAASNAFDTGALLLFFIMVLWQMPHFYAIAIYRMKDYAAAKVPVLPLKLGMIHTKIQIIAYIALYVLAVMLLSVYGYTGYVYAVVMLIFGLVWLWKANQGFSAKDDTKWAKGLFKFSLYVLMAFCITISLDVVLP